MKNGIDVNCPPQPKVEVFGDLLLSCNQRLSDLKKKKKNEDIRDWDTLLMNTEPGTTFLGAIRRQIDILYQYAKYALPFDSTIVHLRVCPIKTSAIAK